MFLPLRPAHLLVPSVRAGCVCVRTPLVCSRQARMRAVVARSDAERCYGEQSACAVHAVGVQMPFSYFIEPCAHYYATLRRHTLRAASALILRKRSPCYVIYATPHTHAIFPVVAADMGVKEQRYIHCLCERCARDAVVICERWSAITVCRTRYCAAYAARLVPLAR